jgi:hypothetical protein
MNFERRDQEEKEEAKEKRTKNVPDPWNSCSRRWAVAPLNPATSVFKIFLRITLLPLSHRANTVGGGKAAAMSKSETQHTHQRTHENKSIGLKDGDASKTKVLKIPFEIHHIRFSGSWVWGVAISWDSDRLQLAFLARFFFKIYTKFSDHHVA